MTEAEVGGYFTGVAIYHLIMKLFAFVPLLLVLGGLFFLVASVRGGSPRFLEAVFNPRLMVLVVIFIMASAFTG